MMTHDEAVCRIVSTYYAPDGTKRLLEGTLTEGDGGKYISANNCVAYVDGALVKFSLVVHRTKGDVGKGSGWVVALRTDDAGKVVSDNDGVYALDFITGNVEVVLNAKHPYAERIDSPPLSEPGRPCNDTREAGWDGPGGCTEPDHDGLRPK